jgi:hypothetical protein
MSLNESICFTWFRFFCAEKRTFPVLLLLQFAITCRLRLIGIINGSLYILMYFKLTSYYYTVRQKFYRWLQPHKNLYCQSFKSPYHIWIMYILVRSTFHVILVWFFRTTIGNSNGKGRRKLPYVQTLQQRFGKSTGESSRCHLKQEMF